MTGRGPAISLRITVPMLIRVNRAADTEGVSRSEWVRRAIAEALDKTTPKRVQPAPTPAFDALQALELLEELKRQVPMEKRTWPWLRCQRCGRRFWPSSYQLDAYEWHYALDHLFTERHR